MSKSLKNFTTIREALRRGNWTSRSLRIIFLLGGWKDGVEITDELRKQGTSFEGYVNNFFLKSRDLERQPSNNSSTAQDSTLRESWANAQAKVHDALCDSFDTPAAMRAISSLITEYNSADRTALTDETVLGVARWLTKIVRVFGLDGSADPNDTTIGWSGIEIPEVSKERDKVRQHAIAGNLSDETLAAITSKGVSTAQQDAAAAPYAEVLSKFQEEIKALTEKKAPAKDFLTLCDQLRDVHLWD